MSYDANYEQLDDYVRVTVRGTRVEGRVASDASNVIAKTRDLLNDSGIMRCLVVLDLAGRLSPVDAFDLVAMSEAQGWPRDCRLAFVNVAAESLDDARFTEVVASNRAFQLRVFGSEDEALDWLLADS